MYVHFKNAPDDACKFRWKKWIFPFHFFWGEVINHPPRWVKRGSSPPMYLRTAYKASIEDDMPTGNFKFPPFLFGKNRPTKFCTLGKRFKIFLYSVWEITLCGKLHAPPIFFLIRLSILQKDAPLYLSPMWEKAKCRNIGPPPPPPLLL